MAKDDQKLREGLANLFKAHGEMMLNTSRTDKKRTSKLMNRKNSKNEYLHGFSEDQIDIEPRHKKVKLKNTVPMKQGKGPLAPNHVFSQKANGKLNGKSNIHKKHNKNPMSRSQKSVDDSSSSQDKVKNVVPKKQQPRSEGGENKKVVGNNNKIHPGKLLETHESEKAHDENGGNSMKPKKGLKAKKKFKKKVQQNRQQQDTSPKDEPQKRKLEKTNKPIRKKPKLSNDHSASKELKILSKKRNPKENSDEDLTSDSMLESDYDSDLDDTYEFSLSDGDDEDDYDSDDYYYDEDSYAESEDSNCDYEDDLLDLSDSDPDYELPKQEVEDLIVHNGLAVKYDLEPHHGAEFDENTEESHIVELPNQTPINTVKQHEAYNVDQLRKLELNFSKVQQKSISNHHLGKSENDECPKLVPINENDDFFKLWTSGVTMDNDMFSDCELVEDSDESSITSFTDLSRKYLHRQECCDSSEMEEDEEEYSIEETNMQAFIVEADENSTDNVDKLKTIPSLEEEETEPSLAEIIRQVDDSTRSSKVKIIKATMENFGEKGDQDEKKSRNGIQNGFAAKDNGVAEESMNTTESEENLTSEMVTDFDEEGDENTIEAVQESESTEMQSDEAEAEDASTPEKFKLSSIFCNSMDSYYVLVLMKSPFFIYGTVNAKLIAGSTEIYGYKLKTNEMVTIHSPRGCCAIPFEPTQTAPSSSEIAKEALEEKIIAEIKSLNDIADFNPREVKEMLSAFDPPNDAILLLTRNETAEKIKHIFQQHVNENIFPAHIPRSRPLFSSEIMLDCMFNATHENALEIPSQWLDIHLKKDSKLMLVGGKSVGKSTFLRYLLNKHLDKFPSILLIDLDIGQPEIFVPQTVSCALLDNPLLGPGFFYQHEPDKAYAVGHTNLALCADTYMRAVINLLDFCKNQIAYSKVPWLINTMGYNKGFGGELISVICAHLQPTDIIQLQSNNPINNFNMLFEPCVVASIPRIIYNAPEYECTTNYQPNHQLHILASAVLQQSRYQKEWQMSAKDLRYIMQLARLSAVLPDEGEWINRSETYCHNLERLKILNLVAPNSDTKETLKSLESNLVYLCHVNTASSNTPDDDNFEDVQNNSPPQCLGLGIVRAIDYQAKQVFILPAMPLEKLTYVNCLALGEMPLPSSLLTTQDPESKFNVPFVQVMNNEATSRAVKQFFYRT